MEQIVAQDERNVVVADEVSADEECLRETPGTRLLRIRETDAQRQADWPS
jgi:hypothetical protein